MGAAEQALSIERSRKHKFPHRYSDERKQYILDNYEYDPALGILYSYVRGTKTPIGWYNAANGYFCVSVYRDVYQVAQLAWLLQTGDWCPGQIDHKNQVKTDNTWENLRECDWTTNHGNCLAYKNNQSGHKNVSLHKTNQKWAVQIKKYGKRYWGGYFVSLKDAINAARKLREEVYGEFCAG
jgi:hypothetical protein